MQLYLERVGGVYFYRISTVFIKVISIVKPDALSKALDQADTITWTFDGYLCSSDS